MALSPFSLVDSSQPGVVIRMKDPRLTWLHSCLLGRRRHDYRAELVLPPSLAWTNMLFKETEWTRDERAGSAWPRLLLLFRWWCCFMYKGCRLFNRCYLVGPVLLFIGRKIMYRRVTAHAGFEPQVFHPQVLFRPVSCPGNWMEPTSWAVLLDLIQKVMQHRVDSLLYMHVRKTFEHETGPGKFQRELQ